MNSLSNLDNQKYQGYLPTWCPGCGNYGIWSAIKAAFINLKLAPSESACVYGIGCSGNMNDFLRAEGFHSLHGRTIPTATGIKIANHKLKVLAIAGDGDCYGEGGNHLLHAARGNHDITVIVHDNRVYGLTTGQVAPTALHGFKAKSTPSGVIEVPLNPLALVLSQGATFVAQGFAPDINHLTKLIVKGIKHRGFSLINIFQPCISFNPVNTYDWYRERIYKLEETGYDFKDKKKALEKAMESDEKLPIGIIYEEQRPAYTDLLPQLADNTLIQLSNLVLEEVAKLQSEFV